MERVSGRFCKGIPSEEFPSVRKEGQRQAEICGYVGIKNGTKRIEIRNSIFDRCINYGLVRQRRDFGLVNTDRF